MEWGRSTDMCHSHAQEALNWMVYSEGTSIQDHIKLLQTCKVAVDNLSTSVMSDKTWRGIIIWSIPPTPKWLPVIPSLYAMSSSANIISTLFAHGMIVGRDVNARGSTMANSSNTALAAQTNGACINPNCKAKKQSTHTIVNCYWPGGGKEGQFLPNFGQRNWVNAVNDGSSSSQPENFILSAQIPNTPGQSGILINNLPSDFHSMALISKGFQSFQKRKVLTFMDSGASDTMFVSRDVFVKYNPVNPWRGDLSGDVIELLIYHQPGVKPSLTLHLFGVLGYVAGHSLTGFS